MRGSQITYIDVKYTLMEITYINRMKYEFNIQSDLITSPTWNSQLTSTRYFSSGVDGYYFIHASIFHRQLSNVQRTFIALKVQLDSISLFYWDIVMVPDHLQEIRVLGYRKLGITVSLSLRKNASFSLMNLLNLSSRPAKNQRAWL